MAQTPTANQRPASGPRLRYRLLTGPDDVTFCERVSAALAEGYVLHGSPTLTFDGERVIAGQAVVLPDHPRPDILEA